MRGGFGGKWRGTGRLQKNNSHYSCITESIKSVDTLDTFAMKNVGKIRNDFKVDGQLDSIAPRGEARSYPRARRRQNHLEFFRNFHDKGSIQAYVRTSGVVAAENGPSGASSMSISVVCSSDMAEVLRDLTLSRFVSGK